MKNFSKIYPLSLKPIKSKLLPLMTFALFCLFGSIYIYTNEVIILWRNNCAPDVFNKYIFDTVNSLLNTTR